MSTISARIEASADKFFQSHINECCFVQFLLNGKHENGDEFIVHMWRNLNGLNDTWIFLLENAIKKSNSLETKHELKDLMRETKLFFKIRDNKFKENFRSIDDNLMSNLQERNCWLMTQFLTAKAVNGSLIDMITVVHSMFWLWTAIIRLKDHPNFVPNKYYDYWCECNVRYILDAFRQLLDAKEYTVSAYEEKHLSRLFKKIIAFGHVCFNAGCESASLASSVVNAT